MPKIPSKTIHARSFSAISRFFKPSTPLVCQRDQPSPQFLLPFQAPDCRFQCIFSWYSTASNNLSRCIYQAQKSGVSHDQCLCFSWFTCSFLQQHYPVSECLLCISEIFLPNYSWFHLQGFFNWRHQKNFRSDCCC